MFKKLKFGTQNYKDLDRYTPHDLKRDELKSFYQTFDFLTLIEKWPLIVGDKLAKVTSPLKIGNTTLIIITAHPSYSDHLTYLTEEIKNQVFHTFPNLKNIIQRITYQTQESFFKERKIEEEQIELVKQQLHPQSPAYKVLKIEAEKFFGTIEDPKVKETLISIYVQSKQI